MTIEEIKEAVYDYLHDLDTNGWIDLYNLCFNEEILEEDIENGEN